MKIHSTMRFRWRMASAAMLIGGSLWACDPVGNRPESVEVVTLLVPDSLTQYDNLKVFLLEPDSLDSPESEDTLETLWDGRLGNPSQLRRLPAHTYRGGAVNVLIEGRLAGDLRYRLLVLYREDGVKPEKNLLPLPQSDTIPPMIFLNDTLIRIFQGESYRGFAVACNDDRDGILAVETTGSVDTSRIGNYAMTYHCQDGAGNQAAPRNRVVEVTRPPDKVPPGVLLNGEDTLIVFLGDPYSDPGAVCLDDRDLDLEPIIVDSVRSSALGAYSVAYQCIDEAGNRSPELIRTVKVVERADTEPPVLTLRNRDTLEITLGGPLKDTGAVCVDGRDGVLAVTATGTVETSTEGAYPIAYACSDIAGNRSGKTQVIVVSRRIIFRFEKETTLDTLDLARNPNHGYTGVLAFTTHPTDRYVTLVKAGLGRISKAGLKAAKIRFHTFGGGAQWTDESVRLTFRIYRLQSNWIEGTGNWYWSDGNWLNGGEALYANYGLADSIKSGSVSVLATNGIGPAGKAIARAENLELLSTQETILTYGNRHGLGAVPKPEDLVTLELNITAYADTVDAAGDFGFLITVEGVPPGRSIGFLTKEIGDGTFGPELIVSY